MNRCTTITTTFALLAAAAPAAAGPETEVASAFDDGDRFDLNASLHYRFSTRSAAIKRELVGFPGTGPDDPVPLVKDLLVSSSRHELVPRLELGVFTDLWLSASLPIVIRSRNTLEFDQRSEPCVFPGEGDPTCINADNSTTIEDGLLPPTGFDAEDPGGPGFTDANDATIFRGPARAGLDQLHLGIGWAPMNQQRDDTKPTWKLGAELRIAVGKSADLDRDDPGRETGVSRGVHEVQLWTSLAKRVTWAIPYVDIWYRAPIGTTNDSPLRDLDQVFGARSVSPQQVAGSRFGFEAIAWEDLAEMQKIGINLSAEFEAHFEGRDLSDMWEVFRYAGDATADDTPLVLDADPPADGRQALSHPGASNIENYMTLTGTLGVDAEIGPRVRFGASLAMYFEQSHLISFADAGVDLPTCTGGQTTGCETGSNDVVDPESAEVNPLHVPLIDIAGHRYRVDEGRDWILGVHGRILF